MLAPSKHVQLCTHTSLRCTVCALLAIKITFVPCGEAVSCVVCFVFHALCCMLGCLFGPHGYKLFPRSAVINSKES